MAGENRKMDRDGAQRTACDREDLESRCSRPHDGDAVTTACGARGRLRRGRRLRPRAGSVGHHLVPRSAAAGLCLLASGCWGGTFGILAASSSGGGGSSTVVTFIDTAAEVQTPSDGSSGRIPIEMSVQFDGQDTLRLASAQFSVTGVDGPWYPLTPALGFPAEVLPEGTPPSLGVEDRFPPKTTDGSIQNYQMDWNSHADFARLMDQGIIDRPATGRAAIRAGFRNERTGVTLQQTTEEFFVDQALVRTVAGGGVGDGLEPTAASMLTPGGVATDASGTVYIADTGNHRIRRVVPAPNAPATPLRIDSLVGTGFQGIEDGVNSARITNMSIPLDLAATPDSNLFFAEFDPDAETPASQGIVRYYEGETGLVRSVIGASVDDPRSLALEAGATLFVADVGLPGIRSFDLTDIDPILDFLGSPTSLSGTILDTDSPPDGTADTAFISPIGVEFDGSNGRDLYACDDALDQVFRFDLHAGTPQGIRVAGGGALAPADALGQDATLMALDAPAALACDGGFLFLADRGLELVIAIAKDSNLVVNVIGGTSRPSGLAGGASALYVCERGEETVAASTEGHRISVLLGAGAPVTTQQLDFVAHESQKEVSPALASLDVQQFDYTTEQTTGTG